jgi:hypothetical protein
MLAQFLFFFTIFYINSNINCSEPDPPTPWCWTKPEIKRIIDPEYGGSNWGYCSPPKDIGENNDKKSD